MEGVCLDKIISKFQMKVFTDKINTEDIYIKSVEVNRPALQLAGFYEHFDKDRIQIIGNVEKAYLDTKKTDEKNMIMDKLLSSGIPAMIYARGHEPSEHVVQMAYKCDVPILGTTDSTYAFLAELIILLAEENAPMQTIHGVLVDVYGEGLLIMGESGIGKSEAALELVRRGHRLVADDVVEIRRLNDRNLIGTAPCTTRHFIELRGIGIIDVKSLYGVECVEDKCHIDLVIKLEEWKGKKEYDRLGLKDDVMNILGIDVVCHSLPIRPGRNLAVICETAAVNHRQKKMGYNAAEELYRRVQENIDRKGISGK